MNFLPLICFLLFPGLAQAEPISAAIASVAFSAAFAVTGSALTAGWIATGFAFVMMGFGAMGLSIGVSFLQGLLFGQKKPDDSMKRSGQLINTRSSQARVKVNYGLYETGANWSFARESGTINGKLNVVACWGEGECEGFAKGIDRKPNFKGKGLNDFYVKGTYTGTTVSKFRVVIDGTGSPNTFKWSNDNGKTWEDTTVDISEDWQLLENGVYIKFASNAAHNSGDMWKFMAGDGIWCGDSLMDFYKYFLSADAGAERDLVPYHNFHSGTSSQTVDTDLQTACPVWSDLQRYTCYSYFQFAYSEEAWKGIPEVRMLGRWRKLYDPRSGFTSWYQTTAVKDTAATGANHVHVDDITHITDGMFIRFTLDDGTTHTTTVNGTPSGDSVPITDVIPASRSCVIDAMVEFDGAHPQGRNGALVWRDWVTNDRYGRGRSSANVDDDAIITVANWLDTNVYYFDGCIMDDRSGEDNQLEIEKCIRAFSIERDNKLVLKTWADDASVMDLVDTNNDIDVSPESFGLTFPGYMDISNKVVANYSEPLSDYATSQVFNEDVTQITTDGMPIVNEISLIGISDFVLAMKLAKFYRLRAKYSKQFSFNAAPRATSLEPGDMITVTADWTDWAAKKVRVVNPTYNQDTNTVRLLVIEEDTSIYDQTVDTSTQDPTTHIIGASSPDMSSFTPTITSIKRGLKVSWADWDGEGYDIVRFVIYCSTDPTCPQTTENWVHECGPKEKTYSITGLAPNSGPYYICIVPYDNRGEGLVSVIA